MSSSGNPGSNQLIFVVHPIHGADLHSGGSVGQTLHEIDLLRSLDFEMIAYDETPRFVNVAVPGATGSVHDRCELAFQVLLAN